MSENMEKRMADTYEITQAIRIGGKEVVFGVDNSKKEAYLCALYTSNELFGEYSECMVGDDYAEMMKMFAIRLDGLADKVLSERASLSVPLETITMEDCFPNDYSKSIEGKVVAIKASSIVPEYRTADHQLVYVTGGNGAHGNARGSACFCINLYSGKRTRWERCDVQGEVKPEKIPDWVKGKLEAITKAQAEKQKEQER